MTDAKELLEKLNKKYRMLGRQHTLTTAERDEYKRQRDQLMNHVKGKPVQKSLTDGIAKLLLIDSFELTEEDIRKHLSSNKDITAGTEFLKSL